MIWLHHFKSPTRKTRKIAKAHLRERTYHLSLPTHPKQTTDRHDGFFLLVISSVQPVLLQQTWLSALLHRNALLQRTPKIRPASDFWRTNLGFRKPHIKENLHYAMTHPQSFWSPDMRRTTAERAQQKDSPAGYIRSRGASLSGHCGPGLQGQPLLSTTPPRSSHAGLSQQDVGVSGGRDECREQKLVTTIVTTKYLILILNIAFLWQHNSGLFYFFLALQCTATLTAIQCCRYSHPQSASVWRFEVTSIK